VANKTRILHVFVTLPVGGAENLLISILKGLDPDRYESVVCTLGPGGELSAAVKALGVPFVELGFRVGKVRSGIIVSTLSEVMQLEKIDIVHSHLYHANRYARQAARKVGIPAVVSIHNTYIRPKLHRRLINWWLARHTSAVLVGSEEVRRDVLRYDRVPAGLIEIIPNSVDLGRSLAERAAGVIRAELSIPDGAYVLGTIGRLEIQKGHRVLIEALQELRDRFPVVLLLIGSGREESALRKQVADLGLEREVRFLGTRSDLGDLFSAMHLFVMPSLWEGLSLAMLSAMAAGLPVVATDVGGVSAVLGCNERGWVVPADNVAALVEAVNYCHEHPQEAAARGEAGRQHVHDNYSDSAMVRRIEAVYARVHR
jgi:glycosyltransferase involved in cell wall biosynthesis